MDLVEFDRSLAVDEVSEHVRPTDGGKLARITDQDDPPLLLVGESREFCQFGCRGGAGLVNDHRRPFR